MIKSVQNFILLLVLIACSHAPSYKKVELRSDDLLLHESYQRYTKEHIKQEIAAKDGRGGASLTLKCYQSDKKETLYKVKESAISNLRKSRYWIDLANCFYLRAEYKKAGFYYRYALTTPKQSRRERAIIYNNLGVIALLVDNLSLARGLFIRSSKEDDKFLTPRFNLAHLYVGLGLWSQAKSNLLKLLKDGPRDVDLLFALGTLHLFRKDYQQANRLFSQISPVYYQRATISNFYALSLLKSGKIEQAMEIWKIGERGGDGSKHYMLASSIRAEIEHALEVQEREREQMMATLKKEQADG
jgi:tetratricopeptide (TPR) repeat protein